MDPVITNVPIDISVHTDTGLPTATVSWTPPTASDNSHEGATLTSNYNPGAAFPIGTTKVTYTATDGAGNRATASFYVGVTGRLESWFSKQNKTKTKKQFSFPVVFLDFFNVEICQNLCKYLSYWLILYSGAFMLCWEVYKIYILLLLYIVIDMERPVVSNLPASISVNTDAGLPTATVPWTPPTASDNSLEGATLTSNYNPGAAFPIGTTTVTYTATDGAGNRATASFYVVVTGKLKSRFSNKHFFISCSLFRLLWRPYLSISIKIILTLYSDTFMVIVGVHKI